MSGRFLWHIREVKGSDRPDYFHIQLSIYKFRLVLKAAQRYFFFHKVSCFMQ